MSLRGRIAIITGASGGIGAATVRALANEGASVALAALPDEKLDALAAEVRQRGVPSLVVPADVANRSDVDQLVAKTVQTFGRVDILVNSAGIGSSPSFCDTTAEELERVLAVNLLGAARLMHAVLPIMKAQRSGSIINVGSVAGEAGVMGIYSASKFGLRGLNDSVRREVRSFNIHVTLIEPGFVRTSMNAAMKNRLPGPEIVARAILTAITRPRRVQIIPSSYRFAVLFTKIFPGLTDLVFGNANIQDRLNRDARALRNGAATDASKERR